MDAMTTHTPDRVVEPDSPFKRALARGHKVRTGHELRAYYEPTDTDGIYRYVYACCEGEA